MTEFLSAFISGILNEATLQPQRAELASTTLFAYVSTEYGTS